MLNTRPHRLFGVLSLGILTLMTAAYLNGDEFGKPDRQSKRVSNIVSQLMDQHLSNRKLNDVISRRALEMYLKNLDPMKMYFLKSDVEEFQQWGTQIDDMMPKGEYTVAFGVFKRFLQRVGERVKLATELIDIPHDFSVDEKLITDRDMIDYAANEEEARDHLKQS